MTLARLNKEHWWPNAFLGNPYLTLTGTGGCYVSQSLAWTIDAAAEKGAMVGHVHWEDSPTSAKTMGSSSKIYVKTSTVTFANASTNMRVGIQDVDATAVAGIRPDGTFDVYKDVTTSTGEISSASDNVVVSFTLDTSGSKSIAEGDLIAVVFDLTARGGSDSVICQAVTGNLYQSHPNNLQYTTLWTNAGHIPNVLLQADDGTLGILRGGFFISNSTGWTGILATTNPDERGLLFQVPFACRIGALALNFGLNANANASCTARLYSNPLGSPSVIWSESFNSGATGYGTDDRLVLRGLASEIALAPNTDYVLAVESTGSSGLDMGYIQFSDAAHRKVQGYANCAYAYRNDAAGGSSPAFTTDTTICPLMGVGITGIDTGQPAPFLSLGGLP